jgi:Collagen triple helix repeat (20 copies)
MFRSIRDRQLNATTAIAIIALVFGMTGGAWAAKRYLITSTKQISPSVLKALRGANGKSGATGASGVAGPAGPAGPTGPTGQGGAQGAGGAKGEQGTKGEQGPKGEDGKKGATGQPWTPNSQLPENATETGAWSVELEKAGTPHVPRPLVSFTIPLKAPLTNGKFPEPTENCGNKAEDATCQVHFINTSGEEEYEPGVTRAKPTACPGNVSKPEAASGNLCIYAAVLFQLTGGSADIFRPDEAGEAGSGTTGALVLFNATGVPGLGEGTWAVTG